MNLLAKLQLKLNKHKSYITPLGDCICRYIIDKYVNLNGEDNYIQAYEDSITEREKYVEKISFFRQFFVDKDGNENQECKHFQAALFQLAMMLYAIKEYKKYYDLIENEERKQVIQYLVKMVR